MGDSRLAATTPGALFHSGTSRPRPIYGCSATGEAVAALKPFSRTSRRSVCDGALTLPRRPSHTHASASAATAPTSPARLDRSGDTPLDTHRLGPLEPALSVIQAYAVSLRQRDDVPHDTRPVGVLQQTAACTERQPVDGIRGRVAHEHLEPDVIAGCPRPEPHDARHNVPARRCQHHMSRS